MSNFFVASFALINFAVFHASITKAPNWRPTFRYYSPWLSLFATLLCIVVMFLMDWRTAIATYLVIINTFKFFCNFRDTLSQIFLDVPYPGPRPSVLVAESVIKGPCNYTINCHMFWHQYIKYLELDLIG